jgi:raffinose/stachyose/melibiose transport system permease protein
MAGLEVGAARRTESSTLGRRRPLSPLTPYLFALPALTLFALFVLGPMVRGVLVSLEQWDGVTAARWVGLSNYRSLLHDSLFWQSFAHAGILLIFYSLIPIAMGLLITALLSHRPIRGLPFYRAILFFPAAVATVVVGVTWRWIYAPDGPLNRVFDLVGLGGLQRAWLGDSSSALYSVGVIGSWQMTGVCMVLFLAGVQRIDPTLYDASRIDGASGFREFFDLTLPSLRPELSVAAALTFIAALRTFDVIYVTTRGGPGVGTYVPSFTIYERAFATAQVGSAAAVAVVMTLLIGAGVFAIIGLFEWRR